MFTQTFQNAPNLHKLIMNTVAIELREYPIYMYSRSAIVYTVLTLKVKDNIIYYAFSQIIRKNAGEKKKVLM